MNQLEITQQYVTYQSQTKLVELAQQVATSRSKTKPPIKEAIQVGTQIRLGLEALNYSQFLTKAQIDEILYLLSDIASINAFPFAPTVNSVQLPTILLGVPGQQGIQGIQGVTGGGFPFLVSNISTDTVVDQFPITLCGAAEWTYDVHDAGNKRVETITGCWLSDGSQVRDDGGVTLDPEIGTTVGKISFYVNFAGGNIQLIAHVTSGNWTVAGSRIQIPVNGNGITLPSSLTNGTIWIGSPANNPVEWPVSGDISLSNVGVSSINPGVIVNADISATAAIALSKLAALSPSLAVVTDINGFLTTSITTAAQIGYLSNVTSDIQAQINNKLTVSLGAAATGDILYYNGINWTNFPKGTAGQLLSSTAGTIAWVSGGSGITNTALNNEMMKSNGVNAVGASMYSTSLGDLILGAPAQAGGARNLSVQGSAGNINLFVQSKGNGGISFYDEVFNNYLNTSKTNFAAVYSILGELQLKSALTSTVGDPLRLTVTTSGTPVIGIGTGIEFATQVSGVSTIVGSIIQSITTDVVGGGTFDFAFLNSTNGAAPVEHVRIKSTGDILLTGSGITSTINAQGWTGGVANTFVQIKGANGGGFNGGLIQVLGGGTGQGSVAISSGDSLLSGFNTSNINLTTGSGTVGNASVGNINLASGVPIGTGAEGSVNIQTRGPLSKISFFNVTPVIKQAAVTTVQGIANVLTAYGLLPSSVIAATNLPAGANTQIQYNNAGAFGASSLFTWDNSTRILQLGSASPLVQISSANGGTNGSVGLVSSGGIVLTLRTDDTNTQGLLESSTNPLLIRSTAMTITTLGGSGAISLITQNTTVTGNVNLTTGNASAGNSGNIVLQTGTATGTRGFITLAATGGNVGIGTAAPSAKLHILGASGGLTGIFDSSAVSTAINIISTNGSWQVGTDNLGNGTSNNQFYIYDNLTGGYRFAIQRGTGNIGIGTQSPGRLLTVGNNDIPIQLTAAANPANNTWEIRLRQAVEGDFQIYSVGAAATRFYIGATGVITIASLAGSGTSTVTASSTGVLGRTTALDFDVSNNVLIGDGNNVFTGLVIGTEFGGSASQKLSFWGKTPIVQPTTAVVAAARVAVGGGVIQVNDTYGGYSIGKIAQALINAGILA